MLYKGSSMGKWSLCLNVLLQIFVVLRVLVRKRESNFLIVRRELLVYVQWHGLISGKMGIHGRHFY
jgi:hypothetical protein